MPLPACDDLCISQLGSTLASAIGVQLLGAGDGEHARKRRAEHLAIRLLESARGLPRVVTVGGRVGEHATHLLTHSRSDVVSDTLQELGSEASQLARAVIWPLPDDA